MEEWDSYINQASELIEAREHYQRVLGRLSAEVADKWGVSRLADLSRDLKETHGLTVSPATLRNYRWVWTKTSSLDLPDDLSYRTLQTIASSGKPEYWADRIKNEGLSSVEVYQLMRVDKGMKPTRKMVICPDCGKEIFLNL